jgi:hypothetical protein
MIETLLGLTTPMVVATGLAAGLLVVVGDWRISIAALAVVYGGVAVLVLPLVLPEVAGAKFMVGVLIVCILVLTGGQLNFGRPATVEAAPRSDAPRRPLFEAATSFPFRLAAAVMVGLAAWYLATQPAYVLPGLEAAPAINTASYLLMALGLLKLGLTEEPINAGLGLLVLLLGFELFYAAVEPSLAIMALLAGVEFAIALAVSYLAIGGHRPAETAVSE